MITSEGEQGRREVLTRATVRLSAGEHVAADRSAHTHAHSKHMQPM